MLEVKDLRVKFHTRGRYAVDGVSFTLRKGETLGLVGESGSGKSVTAMSIAGLLPRNECEYSGSILLDGEELLHAPRERMRQLQGKDMGVVFQEPMSAMDPLMKVGRQVEEALELHTKLSRGERRARALEAMALAELDRPAEICEKYPHELSGGMLQRAMIAAAIVTRPKLLLLDEPTTALDVTVQAQIVALLRRLSVVRRLCARAAVMCRGRLVEQGETEEIFRRPRAEYTRRLIAAIPTWRGEGEG